MRFGWSGFTPLVFLLACFAHAGVHRALVLCFRLSTSGLLSNGSVVAPFLFVEGHARLGMPGWEAGQP